MSKLVEYPTASIKKSLELAKAVDELGGNSSVDMCAEKLHRKVSGGFREIIFSAVKYGFLVHKKGMLRTANLYDNIKLAYNQDEEIQLLQQAFLKIPLFQKIYTRFRDQKLPIDIFDKLLIKEFDVKQHMASRVKKYFIDGAKTVGLLAPDNTILSLEISNETAVGNINSKTDEFKGNITSLKESKIVTSSDSYSITISGPGMTSTISITEEEDLEIVKIMLDKIRKKLEKATAETVALDNTAAQ